MQESNETLAQQIQGGERDKLLPLWTQVRRFVWQRAIRWERACGQASGLTAEDLVQYGFLALLSALEN